MPAVTQQRVRARPARKSIFFHSSKSHRVEWILIHLDPLGPTCLTYTPNGKQLITAGSNNVVRVYTTGSDGEPTNIDDCQENNLAIAATVSIRTLWTQWTSPLILEQNDFFLTGSEDGTVRVYSLETFLFDKLLTRCTLPIRDLALSPDGSWAAVASE